MSDMVLRDHIVTRLRLAGAGFYIVCKKLSEDCFKWAPDVNGNIGRTAEYEVRECAIMNEWGARAFYNRQAVPPTLSDLERGTRISGGRDTLLTWMLQSIDALVTEISVYSDEELRAPITHPFTGETSTWAELAEYFHWNIACHQGEVSYIYSLSGEASFP